MGTVTETLGANLGVSSIFFYLLVPALVLWFIYFRMGRRRLYELGEKIPGPAGLPFFGNALEFTGGANRK